AVEEDDKKKGSLKELFRDYLPQLALATAAALLGIGGFFVMSTYVLSYATESLGLDRQMVVNATLLGAICQIFINLFFGRLCEKSGPGRLIGWGGVATAALSVPIRSMIDSGNAIAFTIALCLRLSAITATYSISGVLRSELFP